MPSLQKNEATLKCQGWTPLCNNCCYFDLFGHGCGCSSLYTYAMDALMTGENPYTTGDMSFKLSGYGLISDNAGWSDKRPIIENN